MFQGDCQLPCLSVLPFSLFSSGVVSFAILLGGAAAGGVSGSRVVLGLGGCGGFCMSCLLFPCWCPGVVGGVSGLGVARGVCCCGFLTCGIVRCWLGRIWVFYFSIQGCLSYFVYLLYRWSTVVFIVFGKRHVSGFIEPTPCRGIARFNRPWWW